MTLDGLCVLVVEDDPDQQQLLRIQLERAGADVEVHDDGRKGVGAALEKAFDVVLMDMRMPVVDGWLAVSLLRAQDFKAPIIAVTASISAKERDRCYDVGCDAILARPFASAMLIDMILGVLARSRG